MIFLGVTAGSLLAVWAFEIIVQAGRRNACLAGQDAIVIEIKLFGFLVKDHISYGYRTFQSYALKLWVRLRCSELSSSA